MKRLLLLGPAYLAVFSCNQCDNTVEYSHRQSQGYNTLYPAPGKLFYTKISIADDPQGDSAVFIFQFLNTFPDFREYEFQHDNNAPMVSEKGEFVVKFNRDLSEDTYSVLGVKVRSGDTQEKEFSMQLSFDPGIVQQRSGRSGAKDGLFIRQGEVGFLAIPPEDFIPPPPPGDEVEFIRGLFEEKIKNCSSDKEKIGILAKEIIDLLEPYRGIPSAAMDTLSAVKQLMKLRQSNEKVYCGNIADIFLSACLSFGIPARKIGLGNTYDESSDPSIYHSDHHSTVEVFDREENTWRLTDLSFYLLEARIGNEMILNFADFFCLLSSPGVRKRIMVSEYEPSAKAVNEVNVEKARSFPKLMDYYKRNQRFFVPHRAGYFSY